MISSGDPDTFSRRVQQAEVDEGYRPGVTSAEAKRIAELERAVKGMRRANAIMRTTSAFSLRWGSIAS